MTKYDPLAATQRLTTLTQEHIAAEAKRLHDKHVAELNRVLGLAETISHVICLDRDACKFERDHTDALLRILSAEFERSKLEIARSEQLIARCDNSRKVPTYC